MMQWKSDSDLANVVEILDQYSNLAFEVCRVPIYDLSLKRETVDKLGVLSLIYHQKTYVL